MPVLIVTILQKDNHGGQDNPEEGLSLRLEKIAITIRGGFSNSPGRGGTLAPCSFDEEQNPPGSIFPRTLIQYQTEFPTIARHE